MSFTSDYQVQSRNESTVSTWDGNINAESREIVISFLAL